MKTILISGGFDPIHIGHVRLINYAHDYGKVVVALNSDHWLKAKKGFVFMPWTERAEILRALNAVHDVIMVDDRDGTVCMALRQLKPDYFANGGDRMEPNPLEHEVCKQLGIKELFNIGGKKIQSSSELVRRMK